MWRDKMKYIFSVLNLVLLSIILYYVICIEILSFGVIGTPYFSYKSIIIGLLVAIVYLAIYIPSMFFLCKQLYQIKKWMVSIPPIFSILLVLASLLFWFNYEMF